jgi:predicted amidohydrolase YtcJ
MIARLALAALLSLVATGTARAQRPRPADEIFTGTFITLDSVHPRAEAIAVRGGRIVAVGARAEVEATAGPATRHTTLPGFVLPGFADAHAHPSYLGEQLETLDLRGLSKGEILKRVKRAASKTPAGQWIRGSGWDQAYWTPPDYPSASDLDSVSAGHPVVLDRIDGHSVWINTRALRLAGLTPSRADPSGGRIIRDPTGMPSGILVDAAVALVTRAIPMPTAAVRQRRMHAALRQYAAWGLTSVHDAGADLADIATYRALAKRGTLPVRLYVMAATDEATLAHTLARGPEVGAGGRLTIRSVKIILDGALGSRGAQLSAPSSDAPGERGFQVNVHAIGDEANHRVLDAFERAGAQARTLRFRVEHVSMLRDDDVRRFASLGVIASMQPVFVGEYSRFAEARVGTARLPWVYRTRDLLESGALIASGTDYPASDAGDPVATLFSMVTRRGADGTPERGWLPSQAVSVDVALRSMTAGAAYASFQEQELGALTVGRRADFTVLSEDPYAVAPADLRRLRALMTVVDGKTVR